MTVKMPGALWLPISGNFTNRDRTKTTALIFHIAVTEAASLSGWFSNPRAFASSHMYVRRDGTIEQYIDLDKISWANGAGNPRSITVETQGMGKGSWTSEQCVSLAHIARFVNGHYNLPLKLMKDSKPSTHGVGYHRLGVNPYRVSGGEVWSKSYGKVCPGDSRVDQIPGIIQAALGSVAPVAVKPQPKPKVKVKVKLRFKYSKAYVRGVQNKLADLKIYKGAIDGLYGPVTEEAVEYYQDHQLFGGLVADGDWGPKTEAHYKWVVKLQRNLNLWEGRNILDDGDYGKVTQSRVYEVMRRNHGGAYKGAVDGVPGPVFCKMLGISVHP
jgi:hypothetical protein